MLSVLGIHSAKVHLYCIALRFIVFAVGFVCSWVCVGFVVFVEIRRNCVVQVVRFCLLVAWNCSTDEYIQLSTKYNSFDSTTWRFSAHWNKYSSKKRERSAVERMVRDRMNETPKYNVIKVQMLPAVMIRHNSIRLMHTLCKLRKSTVCAWEMIFYVLYSQYTHEHACIRTN